MKNRAFYREVLGIAVPVALQSMLQSSFSMIDQIMVGQLGEKNIAAIEIASKPSFIYTVVLGAIAAIAGIMVSQYIGKGDRRAEEKSVCVNLLAAGLTGALFFAVSLQLARPFVSLFTKDAFVVEEGSAYLRLIGWAFLPMGASQLLVVPIRCRGKSAWPLYVGLLSAAVNTFFNYVLIFGHFGAQAMGVRGAAYASVLSQVLSMLLMVWLFRRLYGRIPFSIRLDKAGRGQYFAMLLPILVNEFLWSVGQSVNTYVYGHLGTEELAGMALTGSVQGLAIGALSGLAQAAGILIGRRLGEGKLDKAYRESGRLCVLGLAGAVLAALVLIILRRPYVGLFRVGEEVRRIGAQLLLAFAILLPVKVTNMILGGGIIRSGGKTRYVMLVDVFGTWAVGVPLALWTGICLKLPIVWVYFILSQEEVVRLLISIGIFRSRKWMNTIR